LTKSSKQKAKEAARAFVFEFLSQRHCVDCGEKDIEVLTFDHVKGTKKANVTLLIQAGYSLKTLIAEIEKTEVVCFNCHMRREQYRRGYSRFGRFEAK
jgi:hypothetical protein